MDVFALALNPPTKETPNLSFHHRSRQQSSSQRARQPRPRYNPSVRAGLVLARGMDYAGLGDAEAIFVQEGVALAPMSCGGGHDTGSVTVLPTADVRDLETGALIGVVAPGGHGQDSPAAAAAFEKLVNTAREENLPVMAFGDSVGRALKSLGYTPQETLPPGVLLHDGVRILETADDVRDAVAVFRAAA